MTDRGESPAKEISLCMVIHHRYGNLANALNSANKLVGQIIIVDSGPGGTAVSHIASEFDAKYIQVPADPDESALWNLALSHVKSSWVFCLNQQEVLHSEDADAVYAVLDKNETIAFELPILNFNEPVHHHFETRLIKIDAGLKWQNTIYPSLNDSLESIARQNGGDTLPSEIMPTAAIISLGEPDWEEWELKDALIRIERELDRDPSKITFWYHLAYTALRLEEWDRSHSAVEEGLSVISRTPDIALNYPFAVNGLVGMFCGVMLRSDYFPEKTVSSLLTIFQNMPGDGRFSVPLGRLLSANGRRTDATAIQHSAIENFFAPRRYPLSLVEGLFKPAMLKWELNWNQAGDELLTSVIEVQTILGRHKFKLHPILEYIYQNHRNLFIEIQTVLQRSLKNLG